MYDKEKFLNQAFEHNFNHIALADSKAVIFITIQSLLITVGIAGSLLSDTFGKLEANGNPYLISSYIIFLSMYVITSLVGILMAINIFRPRGPSEDGQDKGMGLLYFGHISNFDSSEEYHKAIVEIDQKNMFKELCDQIYQIAKIADEKMANLRKGVIFLLINVIFTVVMLFFTVLIHLL